MNWIDAKKTPPRKGKWVLIWIPSLKDVKIGMLVRNPLRNPYLTYKHNHYIFKIKNNEVNDIHLQREISLWAEIEKPNTKNYQISK